MSVCFCTPTWLDEISIRQIYLCNSERRPSDISSRSVRLLSPSSSTMVRVLAQGSTRRECKDPPTAPADPPVMICRLDRPKRQKEPADHLAFFLILLVLHLFSNESPMPEASWMDKLPCRQALSFKHVSTCIAMQLVPVAFSLFARERPDNKSRLHRASLLNGHSSH